MKTIQIKTNATRPGYVASAYVLVDTETNDPAWRFYTALRTFLPSGHTEADHYRKYYGDKVNALCGFDGRKSDG